MTLGYALGYNNGVTLLDNICDTCFTDKAVYSSSKGQNLKLEQVLEVKANNISNIANTALGTERIYTFAWPYIWDIYKKTQTNHTNTRSRAYTLTPNSSVSSTSEEVYSNYWHNNSMNLESAWYNSKYYNLIIPVANAKSYWLSSRYVEPKSNTLCFFGLQLINSNGITGIEWPYLYVYDASGNNTGNSFSCALRPIISFPRSMYELEEQTDGSYNIIAK